MPDPVVGASVLGAGSALAVLTVAGVPTGLHADQLLAGLLGAVAAMALLDSVPSTGDTWRELLRTSVRRLGVAVGSAVMAGYCTPLVAIILNVPTSVLLALTFVVGASAQRILRSLVDKTDKGVRRDAPPPAQHEEGSP